MILVTKFDLVIGIFKNMYEFLSAKIPVKFNKGEITIDGWKCPFTYNPEEFTPLEALTDFSKEEIFLNYCKARFYRFYIIESKL